jgi:hypothetical protein
MLATSQTSQLAEPTRSLGNSGSVPVFGADIATGPASRREVLALHLGDDAADDAGVRFAPKATLLLRSSEMTRWAMERHYACSFTYAVKKGRLSSRAGAGACCRVLSPPTTGGSHRAGGLQWVGGSHGG